MTDGITKAHARLVIDGTAYEFDHLAPRVVCLQGHGRDGSDIRVRLSFQTHVYSRACGRSGADYDFRDEGQNKRCFCPRRYAQSKDLANLCETLVETKALTWVSQDKNRASNLMAVEGALTNGQHYVIVYYLFVSRVPGIDVEMVIKSAYEKEMDFSRIKRRFNTVQLIKTCYYERKRVP
ncbi:MAG TPA: hypothetical protein ENK63_05180 [Rhodobacterales bacterium]|nr:hypothetical protein [Rhodobacterales bacterium]